ncbi:3-oxoacid CoA-transferase subunit A [Chloroflexota bacterium]
MINKICESFDQAVSDIPDGALILVFHFATSGGTPQNLLWSLKNQGVKDLTVVSFTTMGVGPGIHEKRGILKSFVSPNILFESGMVKKGIVAWAGPGRLTHALGAFETAFAAGKVDGEIVPMGVLAHRIRAGGSGIGAFYSPVGLGTLYERGKEKRIINGKEYILEYPIIADFGLVRAYKADKLGNLIYHATSRGINNLIAKASRTTIAEVDEIVEIGELDPEVIVTSGIYIDRIVKIGELDWK